MVVNPDTLERIGFELSPWSTHGRLVGTKGMTQAQINAKAKSNREAEQEKCKAYFREHGIFVLVYTDEDLAKPERIFADIRRSLETKHAPSHLEDHALVELRRSLRRS